MHQRSKRGVSEIEPLPLLMRRLDWNHLKVFLAVAESGSFRRGATRLSVGPATAARHISDLEDTLGSKLFYRTPNAVQLTEEGQRILHAAREMEQQVLAIETAASGAIDVVAGRVALATTDGLGAYWLPYFLPKLHNVYPDLHIDLISDTRRADVLRHEADVSVQYAEPSNADIVYKTLGHIHVWIYASRNYADAHGLPTSMADVYKHKLVIQDADQLDVQTLISAVGKPQSELNYAMARSSTSHYEMVKNGIGLGVLPTYLAFGDPDLVPLEIFLDHSLPIRVCYHTQQRHVARVRATVDWLKDAFSPQTYPFFAKKLIVPSALSAMAEPPKGTIALRAAQG